MSARLAQLQQNFQHFLLYGEDHIDNYIVGKDKDFIKSRLAIYAEGYRLRLLDVVSDDYPVTQALMSEQVFHRLVDSYIKAYPSETYSIRHFGFHLPRFLAETEPYKQQPYLAELAEFEWRLDETIDAADATSKTREDLLNIPQEEWNEMKLVFHPAMGLFTLNWNIIDIKTAYAKDEALPEPKKTQEPVFCLVWRKDLRSYYQQISSAKAAAIQTFIDGNNFAQACEALMNFMPEDEIPIFVVDLLARLLEDKLIIDIVVG